MDDLGGTNPLFLVQHPSRSICHRSCLRSTHLQHLHRLSTPISADLAAPSLAIQASSRWASLKDPSMAIPHLTGMSRDLCLNRTKKILKLDHGPQSSGETIPKNPDPLPGVGLMVTIPSPK